MSRKWGVDKKLLEGYLARLKNHQDDAVLRKEIEKQNKKFRRESLLKLIKDGNTSDVSRKPRRYLLAVAKKYPNNFNKMAVTPEGCFAMAAMAVAVIKNIILGIPYQTITIDLARGKAEKQ